jgi:hypothetical protein
VPNTGQSFKLVVREEMIELIGPCNRKDRIMLLPKNVSLLQMSVKKEKKVRSLSPLSGVPRRIGAVADEERSRPQFD